MSDKTFTQIDSLPTKLTHLDAVKIAYREDLEWVVDKIVKGMNVLIECEKQLYTFVYKLIRTALKENTAFKFTSHLIAGPDPESGGNIMRHLLAQTLQRIFSGESNICLFIPHLDVAVTTSKSGMTDTSRELMAAVYDNPDVRIVMFKDPSLEIPEPIEHLFSAKRTISGITRDILPSVIIQTEAKKFGHKEFNPFKLYKYVSGMNVVRLREVLESFHDRVDYNKNDESQTNALYRELRNMTITSDVDFPNVSLDNDIGGYSEVKKRIKSEIIELLNYKETLTSVDEVKQIEEIIPKGMIFSGPPGTGKTFFAKAMATALDATIIIVSGPELKSKWVGDSEKNIRDVFMKARKSAPSIIVFDEIDSFATHRGTYGGSGVEHSMVNQLLTEMDGFRKEDLVFIVATTNFVESIDAALLRPGRFELQIEIPYPKEDDRKIILDLYRKKFNLNLSDDLIKFLVDRTGGYSDVKNNLKFSGDHLNAIARGLKRESIRRSQETAKKGKFIKAEDIVLNEENCMAALPKSASTKIKLSVKEEKVIAVHEVGHAIIGLNTKNSEPIEKITIASDKEGALGYVLHETGDKKYVQTRGQFLDTICILFGGREAEMMFYGDFSAGCANDLEKATDIARLMVERLGMSDATLRAITAPVGHVHDKDDRPSVSAELSNKIDVHIDTILKEQQKRCQTILSENRPLFDKLLTELLDKKTLLKVDIEKLVEDFKAS